MKTPRQILMEDAARHDSDLDEIRLQTIKSMFPELANRRPEGLRPLFSQSWIGPLRWYWSTLAATWMLIGILNHFTPSVSVPSSAVASDSPFEWDSELMPYTQWALWMEWQGDSMHEVASIEKDKESGEVRSGDQPPGPQSRWQSKNQVQRI